MLCRRGPRLGLAAPAAPLQQQRTGVATYPARVRAFARPRPPLPSRQLATLRAVRVQYERTAPRVLCGFAVTREAAAAALEPQPRGAFLLRFTTSGAGLALSLSRGGGGGVEHWQLPQAELERRGLEALVARVAARAGCPLALLDLQTGQLHDRQAVLPLPLRLPGDSSSGGSSGACKRSRAGRGSRASSLSGLSGAGEGSSPSSGMAGPAVGPLGGLPSPALNLALGSPPPAPLQQAQGWQPQQPADAAACAGSSLSGHQHQQQQQLALQGWAPYAHLAQQQQQQPLGVPVLACAPVLSRALAGAAQHPAAQAQLAQAPSHQPCYAACASPAAAAAAASPLPASQLPGAAAACDLAPPPLPGLQSVPSATSVLAVPMQCLLQPCELVSSTACAIVNASPASQQPCTAFGAGAVPAPPSCPPPQLPQLCEQQHQLLRRQQSLMTASGACSSAADRAALLPLGAPCLPPAAAEPLAWLGADGGGASSSGNPPPGLDLLQLDDCGLGGPMLGLPPELFADGDPLLLFGSEPS